MPFKKIPVNAPFWSNIEDESRSTVVEQRRDVMKDVSGSTIRRPALVEFATGLPGLVSKMFYWENTNLVYFITGADLYSLTGDGTASLVESSLFNDGINAVWAESSDLTLITVGATRKIFCTNGGEIVEYDGTTANVLADADAPVESSHVLMFDSYLLSNELSDPKYDESILYSVVADPINFEGAYFSAENKADPINAMHSAFGEIALFGSKSVENFYNDGVTPFSIIPGGTVELGTKSPWTIRKADNGWFMLTTGRRLARIVGRQPIILSQPIDDILSESAAVTNAQGDLLTLKGNTLYLLTINNRTFVYDYAAQEWVGEWGYWNKETAAYDQFKGMNFINVKEWGLTLCADKTTGTIYKFDFDTYQDDGDEIRSSVVTGNIDHKTGREKRSSELRLKLKRGKVSKTSVDDIDPKMLVRWRDNGSKVWSNYREVSLGSSDVDGFYYSLFQLGSYRSRQYEFVCSDNTPFSIVEADEDVDLLR